MKNILFLGGAAAALIYFLRQKRAAGENLRVEPVDIAIDSARSASTFWAVIYYNIKLRFINVEAASVNVSAIRLNILLNDSKVAEINQTEGFIVAAKSEKIVNLQSTIQTAGIVNFIVDLIQNGFRFNIAVSGYVDTDLGRIAVNYTKNF